MIEGGRRPPPAQATAVTRARPPIPTPSLRQTLATEAGSLIRTGVGGAVEGLGKGMLLGFLRPWDFAASEGLAG